MSGNHIPFPNDIQLNDTVKKKELPVHVILRVNDYAKVKMQERPRIGQPGSPIAELTQFGQFIMSPGHESNFSSIVCSLDVLGIEENHSLKYTEFLDNFKKTPKTKK